MLREFVQYISSRGDRIRTQIEFQTCLLSSSDETVGRSLVTSDIHIASRHLLLRLYAIDVDGRRVGVVSVVVTSLDHLDVCLSDGRLLGELLAQEVGYEVQVAIEEPADETQGEHVTALHHGLHVHTRVSETVLHHRGEWALDHAIWVDIHLTEIVFSLELSLLQVLGTEGVGIDDDGGTRLSITVLRLQRSSVHGYQHVAFVARRIDLTSADVNLETRHTGERTLRGADVSGIVGKCRDAVTNGGTDRREDVSSELHTVARVTREAYDHLVKLLHF